MSYHSITPYKKKAYSSIDDRNQADLTEQELTEVNSIISKFITKFKEEHL
jgi:hypothetical protein